MLAPNQVNAPATIHTSSIPPKVGTARLTSDGWTKIDDPTMVPTTIAVACVRPIERASLVDIVVPLACRLRHSGESPKLARFPAERRGKGSRSCVESASQTAGARGFQPSDRRMLSPNRRGLSRGLLVDRLDGRERVRLGRGLVAAIPLDAREAEREAARILGARLDVVERDLGNDLRAHVDGVAVAPDLELEERLGL